MSKNNGNFESAQIVYHKNLGKGVFIEYDMLDNEVVVEFTDEDRYKDKLRVSTSILKGI